MVTSQQRVEAAMTRRALIGFLLLALLAAPQVAQAHDDAAPPKRLGTVAFANSCAPQAQESFERGVALLHSFAFVAGEQAFREALGRDPACAIATWGIATVLDRQHFRRRSDPGRRAARFRRNRTRPGDRRQDRARARLYRGDCRLLRSFRRAAAARAHAVAGRRLRSSGQPLRRRRRGADLQRALPHRHSVACRQELWRGR